jgi:hypothetical protein
VLGDHLMILGEVLSISKREVTERPLLAIGPTSEKYEVLAKFGIHTLGVVRR